MTTGRDVARDESVARFRDWLAARGQPATPQRIAIATEALGAERPLSAEDLVERLRVKGPAPGVATVYRTLDALVEGGLLSESLDPREGFRRFVPLRDDVSSAELLCTGCGGVTRVADDVVGPRARSLAEAASFVPVKHRLVVYGLCAGCRAERDAAGAARGGR